MSPHTLRQRGTKILLFWLIAGLVVLIDQATKTAIRFMSPETGPMGTLIPGVIDLVHVENTGAAFSMGEGSGGLFVVIAIAVSIFALIFVCREDLPLSLIISIACVVGGGLGNMIDRIMRGSVTDFLSTAFMDFPVFNVADIAVTCGIVISLIGYLMWERSLSTEER
ncbi:MAG: signal peptidase II [Atopobiaceae bacterium]|nr:signal peptidase II [Atopobiaceae bacterium]